MRKIAIVVGHNASAQGAVRATDGRTEYDWNGELAEQIRALNPAQVRVFRREASRSYAAEIRAVYDAVNAWGADVSAELHFNAAPGATGTETLCATERGREVAEPVQRAMVAVLGLRDRGVKKVGPGDRGHASLVAGSAPAVLLEPYFGSYVSDATRADECRDALALAIFTALGGVNARDVAPEPPVDATTVAALQAEVARLQGVLAEIRALAG